MQYLKKNIHNYITGNRIITPFSTYSIQLGALGTFHSAPSTYSTQLGALGTFSLSTWHFQLTHMSKQTFNIITFN